MKLLLSVKPSELCFETVWPYTDLYTFHEDPGAWKNQKLSRVQGIY